MAGYVIANVVWKDPESLAVYKRLMPPSVEKYGGRFLVPNAAFRALAVCVKPEQCNLLSESV